ncbi:lipase [Aquibium microcysteis]|uniref:lipase n=1 Tax=Aquibium microcysteis TaxID=675281 RepID=UPI00165D1CA0|nr:lipase [Aquibium microcysteis]
MTAFAEPGPPMTRHAVARRAVFHVGGYERNDAGRFFARFGKELARFAACWSVEATLGPVAFDRAGHVASASVDCRAASRATRTDFVLLDYDDIVMADGARPLATRVVRWLAAFFDYVATGTMFRFFAANWRFALYFLYPLLGIVGPVLLGFLVWRFGRTVPVPAAGVVCALLGAALAVLLIRRLARRYFLFHLMDLWSFSREWLRGRRPAMEARIAVWARAIDERVLAGGYEEVVLVGHSTGGAIILDVAAAYAARVAARGEAPAFTLLTVGSTGPKITLHPAAKGSRERLRGLVAHPGVDWGDFQAVADIINFYRCDQLALAGIPNPRTTPFPFVRRVRFRSMLDKAFYRSIRFNVFRLHYQFISANTKHDRYDFFMMCCGPHPIHASIRGSLVPRRPETS